MPAPLLTDVTPPDFGLPTVEPAVPAATYAARQRAAMARARAAGLDALAVYGDREHMANLAYLTGYDPRFEEALLVMVPGRTPTLMVGNEGWGYAGLAPGPFQRVLFQSFSLLDQPRGRSMALPEALRAAGIAPGAAVGSVGWKCFGPADGLDAAALEIPSYLADALRALAGRVENASGLFMNARDGLRAVNDVDQLAVFEHAATWSSQGVRDAIHALRPGMTEFDAMRAMGLNGLPQSCHPMLSTGPRAWAGLPSPSAKRIARGEPITMACGLWGALTARAGWVAEGPQDLPEGVRDYVERLVAPYFAAAAAWWSAVGIGVTGGALHAAVMAHVGDPFFGVGLNPGHLIHLDEWLSSPVAAGSDIPLCSGMALQVDIIPATGGPWFTSNVEDGLCLADEALRDAFAARWPEAWGRIQARRAFMEGVLGIALKPEVLPFSNTAGWLPPFLLAPHRAMALR